MDLKHTVFFSGSAYLSLCQEQMIIDIPAVVKNDGLPLSFKREAQRSLPIEDIGLVILESPYITITQPLLSKLMEHNVVVITCDAKKMPVGMMLPMSGNNLTSERTMLQIECNQEKKDRLWQQIVSQKIRNQCKLLENVLQNKLPNMRTWSSKVTAGDATNLEGRAAAYYWKNLFGIAGFKRERFGDPPNNWLNYGYAVLRGLVARSLVGSGLLTALGVHHHNRYIPFVWQMTSWNLIDHLSIN